MRDRYALLQRGLFPETLPPCFTSADLKRALHGITSAIHDKAFHKRNADYIRYNGTKHDGSRRYFGTPNPIAYFYVSDFVAKNWDTFQAKYQASPFSVSQPKTAQPSADRAIIIPSLSELTTEASKNIGYAPYILKTDIAQFYPSIYTHSIPWAAHGIDLAKNDQSPDSKDLPFNQLDYFVRNCQLSETRGVLVGPDAFRAVAEFLSSSIDVALHESVGEYIIGAARHVDDYYIGLKSETDALVVLSKLRDILQRYNLNINDSKTKIISGLEPLNDLWAQDLRNDSRRLRNKFPVDREDVILFITKALNIANLVKSDSPVKIAVRTLDQIKAYSKNWWDTIEPYLQRIIFHHSHCIDYAALLTAKRIAIGEPIDNEGWSKAILNLLKRHIAFNHHHEILWLLWLFLSLGRNVPEDLINELCKSSNSHILTLVISAFSDKRINRKPPIRLGSKLSSNDSSWLLNIVARSEEYSKAKFSGPYAEEFEHMAQKNVIFLDLNTHMQSLSKSNVQAISRTRYGYDSDDDSQEPYDEPF